MLIQAFIGGVRDDRTRESLLAESRTLEWEKACNLARNREAMQRELHQFPIAEIPPASPAVTTFAITSKGPLSPKNTRRCQRCGESHSNPAKCKHKQMMCHFCHKIGHLEKVCFAKKRLAHKPVHLMTPNDNCEDGTTEL